MMDSIRVRNLRSFVDCNEFEQPYARLKPLTIFLGKNSCGKSSLLRVLPLLKQSNNDRVTAPISWFGKQVDFGSFNQAQNNNATNNKIYFDFIFNFEKNVIRLNEFNFPFENEDGNELKSKFKIEMKIGLIEKNRSTTHNTITINFNNNVDIKLDLSDDETINIKTNNHKFSFKKDRNDYYFNGGHIVPKIALTGGDAIELMHLSPFELPIDVIYKNYISSIQNISKKTKKSTIENAVSRISICNYEAYKTAFYKEFENNKSILQYYSNNEEQLKIIFELHISSLLTSILNYCSNNIRQEISGIRYIGPIRASAERYYRHEELYIDEIDPKGDNLPLFLSRLTEDESDNFRLWTMEHFDFSVRSEQIDLHHQIKIKLGNDKEQNISDMGFGFSQILPIVVSLWHEMRTDNRRKRNGFYNKSKITTFVIEQPELHLHPEYQALLAKTFIYLIKYSYIERKIRNIRIIFETHSQTIIDAIGHEVENNNKLADLVNILIFEKDEGKSHIKESHFDKDGDLVNWPVGFFSGR